MGARFSDDLVEVLSDGVDFAAEALEIIPIVGIAVKAAKLAGSVPDYLFAAKCEKLFSELNNVPKHKIEKFKSSIDSEDKLRALGRSMVFLIDRMDDDEKPVIVGRLFSAVLEEKLDLETMKRLGSLLNLAYTPDLQRLHEFKEEQPTESDDSSAASLAAAGFLKETAIDYGNIAGIPTGSTVTYILNEYGRALLKFGLTPRE